MNASLRSDVITRSRGIALVLATSAGMTGCPSEPVEPKVPVVVARFTDWKRVTDPATDAFAQMRPANTPCDASGVGIEQLGLSFEIKTGLCDYATVAQPTAAALEEGDVLGIRIWHDLLDAPMASEGFIGLAIDGEMVWHDTVPIPSGYGTVNTDLTIEDDLAQGTELQIHIHNHGVNSWNILDFRTIVDTDESS